jgi:hypothetical protein
MAVKRGAVVTWDLLDTRRDWDYSKQIMQYYPDASPFTVMLLRTNKGATDTLKTFWPEDVDDTFRTLIDLAAGYDGNAVTLKVDDATVFMKGNIIMNTRTMEHMMVDADPDDTANTIHVIRGYGETAAAAIINDDPLIRLANASAEISNAPGSRSTQPGELWNAVQMIRDAYEVSEQNEKEKKKYGKSERGRLNKNTLKIHRKSLERTILWGERHYDATNKDANTMGGLLTTFIKTNVYNAGGTLTESKLYEFDEMAAGASDSDSKVLVCSPRVITVVNKLFAAKINPTQFVKKWGMNLKTITLPHASYYLVESKALSDDFAFEAVSVDMDNIEVKIFAGEDTKLFTNIKKEDGYTGIKDEFRTQMTLQVTLEKKHARMTNVQN